MRLQLGDIESDYKRWLKSYMRHLKYKDSSKNTLELYMRILHQLLEFIQSQSLALILQDMNKEFFLDFLEYCEEHSKNGHFSKKTKQLYISILKSLFVYISDNNDELYIFENEFKISINSTKKITKVKYLTDQDNDFSISDLTDAEGNKDIYEIHLQETKSGEEQTALIKIEDIKEELDYF